MGDNMVDRSAKPEMTCVPEREIPSPEIELGDHPQMTTPRHHIKTLLFQVVAALWLVPIGVLLWMNISGFVIGASAWCPGKHCWLDAFNPATYIPQQNEYSFAAHSHTLLARLQFAAKALEIWFTLIATALVYLVTMRCAGEAEGFPIGYVTRPVEFAEVVGLFDRLLWTTGPSPFSKGGPQQRKVGRRVWGLILLSVVLCGLCNLMGPSTAVLVIPALTWIDTPKIGNRTFDQFNSAQPPTNDTYSWFWWRATYCFENDLAAHNYSCTQDPWGTALDEWITSSVAGQDTAVNTVSGVTVQDGLTFGINITDTSKGKNIEEVENTLSNFMFWSLSRQTITNLSVDALQVACWSDAYNESTIEGLDNEHVLYPDPVMSYKEYNRSLDLVLQRDSPIVGALPNMWVGYDGKYQNVVEVSGNRQIRCYSRYDTTNVPLYEFYPPSQNYTKCIRTGTGWDPSNGHASFTVQGQFNTTAQALASNVTVDIYSSDLAVFFPNGTLPAEVPAACLTDGPVLNSTICDWDSIFVTSPYSPLYNRTQNVNTIEMTLRASNGSVKFVVDFVAYQGFTTYTVDPEPENNPQQIVQTNDIDSDGTVVPVDPNWILAAWSADQGGVLGPTRAMTNTLLIAMNTLFGATGLDDPVYTPDNLPLYQRDFVALLPVMQTLSLIDYSTNFTTQTKNLDPAHPLLQRSARMYVWGYGISDPTVQTAVAVAMLGAIAVMVQVVLGTIDRRPYRSVSQLLVAALEHAPKGEFAGRAHDEDAMARVRFHIKDDEQTAGGLAFFSSDT